MTAVDDNGIQPLYGVSHRDGRTPVQVKFDADRKMLRDTVTAIEFDPTINMSQTDNDRPIAKAVDDNGNIRPWVVNEDTGAVLVTIS